MLREKGGEMNTLLNEQGLLKALIDGKTDKYESEDMDNAEDVAIAQDLRTKSILADEVRKIEITEDLIREWLGYNKETFLINGVQYTKIAKGMKQAVLKLMEGKE